MRRCFALTSRAAFIGLPLCAFLPRAALAQSDLDRAYRIIAAKTFVDLTHSFGPETPVWSGFGQARMTAAADPKTQEPYTTCIVSPRKPKVAQRRAVGSELVGHDGGWSDALLLQEFSHQLERRLAVSPWLNQDV